MTPRDKPNSGPRPSAGRAVYEDSARLFEHIAAVLAGVAIALRPLPREYALTNSGTLLLHTPIVLAAFLWLVAQGMRGRARIAQAGIGIPLIVYVIAIAVSPVLATYKYAALRAAPVWLTNLLLLFIVLNLSRDGRFRRFFIAVFLASSAVVAFHGLYQQAGGLAEYRHAFAEADILSHFRSASEQNDALARINSTESFASFPTSNILASFLLLCIPVFFASALSSLKDCTGKDTARAIILFIATAAAMLCLYFTGSLAGQSFFVAELIIFPLIFFRRWVWRHRLAFAVCLAILIVLVATVGMPYAHRVTGTLSVNLRFGYWLGAWGMFKAHWLTGVGLENFEYNYPQFKPPWAGEVQYPHNSVIQSATDLGVIGLAAFVAIWAMFIARVLRAKNGEREIQFDIKGSDPFMSNSEDSAPNEDRFMAAGGIVVLVFVFIVINVTQPFESFFTSLENGLLTALVAAAIWAVVYGASGLFARRWNGPLMGAALATGALGFFLHCQFDFAINSYPTNQAGWVIVALALAAWGARFPEGTRMKAPARALLGALGLGLIVFYTLGPLMLAAREDAALGGEAAPPLEALTNAEDANPLNAETHSGIAEQSYQFWVRNGRKNGDWAYKAVDEMRYAIRLNPAYFAYHADAAIMLQDMGRNAEAMAEYNQAVQRYPTRPALYVYRATLEDALGMKDAAKADTDEATRLLAANRLPDGTARQGSLELDTVRGLPVHGSQKAISEQEMYDTLRAKYK